MGGIDNGRGARHRGGLLGAVAAAALFLAGACGGATEARAINSRTTRAEPAATAASRPGIPYSLTISGGLSLGAYEAGMNWALIEWMRSRRLGVNSGDANLAVPELVGVTGASAGAINALFSAVRWCEGSGMNSSVEENIFSSSWRPIGFEQMIPDDPTKYASLHDRDWDPDFIVSRKNAFHGVLGSLRTRLASPGFRPDCRVPVSLVVTKILPGRVRVDSLSASTQRYVVALVAETVATEKGHRLRFRLNDALAKTSAQQLVGNIVWLSPGSRSGDAWEVDQELVLDALQASSAHPSSFGPVLLPHCAPASSCRPSNRHVSQTCRELGKELGVQEPFAECTEPFNDGGAFDNVPIGAAVAQVEREPEQAPRFPPRYIYMDPNSRRTWANAGDSCVGEPGTTSGLAGRSPTLELTEFIDGFFNAAFDYELQGVLRYLEWNRTMASLVDQTYRSIRLHRGDAVSGQKEANRREEAEAIDRLTDTVHLEDWRRRRADLIGVLLEDLSVAFGCRKEPFLLVGPREAGCRGIEESGRGEAVSLFGELEDARDRLLAWRDSARNGRRLRIPQRLAPITGAMLRHFAAWVDRPFRDYDYYAGIHDGLAAIADWECEGGCPDEATRRDIAGALIRELGLEGSNGSPDANAANEVVTALMDLDDARRANRPARFDGRPSAVGRVLAALVSPDRCTQGGVCRLDCPFETFVDELRDANYRPTTELGKEILSRGGDWWTPVARRVADRLERIEEEHDREGAHFSEALGWAQRIGSVAIYHQYYQTRDSLFEPPSSARHPVLRALAPYLVVSGSMERKFDLGVAAYGACMGRWCSLIDLSVRTGWFPADAHEGPDGPFDPERAHWSLDLHGGVRMRMHNLWLSSLQLRAGWTPPGMSIGVDLPHRGSLELDFGLVFDRFRVAVGCNAFDDRNVDCHRNPYVAVGLNDLTGWLTHLF